MISFFPSPYPDELWYSVICRYYVHSGNSCAKHTMRQLYGDNFSAPSLMLCGAINTLLAQLPQGFLSAKDVVCSIHFSRITRDFSLRSVSVPPMLTLSMAIQQPYTGWVFHKPTGIIAPQCAIAPSAIKRTCNYMVSHIGIVATNCRICKFAPSIAAG